MNHALGPIGPLGPVALAPRSRSGTRSGGEDAARLRRLQSLLALLSLYAAALLVVITVSDGADIGCILGGIAGHVLFATVRTATAWRDAAWLERAKLRLAARA